MLSAFLPPIPPTPGAPKTSAAAAACRSLITSRNSSIENRRRHAFAECRTFTDADGHCAATSFSTVPTRRRLFATTNHCRRQQRHDIRRSAARHSAAARYAAMPINICAPIRAAFERRAIHRLLARPLRRRCCPYRSPITMAEQAHMRDIMP